MPIYDLLIINGIVVTDKEIGEFDVAVKGEQILAVEPRGSFSTREAVKVIDAQGGYVMPGGVDAHVHLQEPPMFGKGSTADNYETGSRSAIAGGTTTIITFAPQRKHEPSLLTILAATHAKAANNCFTDYSFHLLVSNPTPTALAEFATLRREGISSLKIYMTYEALQLHDAQILDVLLEARKNGITTMVHAENGHVIEWMTRKLEEEEKFAPKWHGTSHPPMAEFEATYRAICLSEFIDTPILIVHVSSPVAVEHIRAAQKKGLPIFAETCPQYVFLTAADLDKPGFEGAKCVCAPPPREGVADHEGIWEGLKDGTFTVFSSDHCPFKYEDREMGKMSSITPEYPEGRFRYIPNGIAGIETRLPLAMSAERLELRRLVQVTSTDAAKLYGLYPRKGALLPGSDADVTVWYPPTGKDGSLAEFELKNEMLHHNVDYTPFEGKKLKQWPRWTILRGQVVWDREKGGLLGEKGYGKFIKRDRSCLTGSRGLGEWKIPE
ncbi:D-hydantoinase [Aulographum hederae CBS 113979]|uniref:D-hydantoinase n=1 Tax=Aulographum hederae CBS 113979 TaxID=1176131 RepID=A0A6G1HBV7_9PEZI|nr:D-hydantoinase [Aulographum hederae CBS 113979]